MRQYLHRLMSLRSHLKKINMFFGLKCLGENQEKIREKSSEIREKLGKNQGI